VATRGVDPGLQVTPGAELFYVVDPSAVEAVIHVPERSLGRLAEGGEAYVLSEALGSVRFPGQIRLISPVVDPQTGTVKVTVALEMLAEGGAKLRPGMFVSVYLITARRESATLVPKRAVVYEDNTPFVFVATDRDGKLIADKRTVKLGFEQEERMEVVEGVAPAEKVIVIGHSGLKDGTLVEVTGGR
jgi:RND family efflux transporter MFP subunit